MTNHVKQTGAKKKRKMQRKKRDKERNRDLREKGYKNKGTTYFIGKSTKNCGHPIFI